MALKPVACGYSGSMKKDNTTYAVREWTASENQDVLDVTEIGEAYQQVVGGVKQATLSWKQLWKTSGKPTVRIGDVVALDLLAETSNGWRYPEVLVTGRSITNNPRGFLEVDYQGTANGTFGADVP